MIVALWCSSESFNKCWNSHFGKENVRTDNQNEEEIIVHFSGKLPKSNTLIWKSFSAKFNENINYIKLKIEEGLLSIVVKILFTMLFTIVQLMFTRNLFNFYIIENAKTANVTKQICQLMEEYFLFEDLIYLPFSLLFLTMLFFFIKPSRFSKYIMSKFRDYFECDLFKNVQENQENQKRKNHLRQKKCVNCKYLFSDKFCDFFYCLFCCSCCVPTDANTRCFFCYCCCSGWGQTDFIKVVSWFFLVPVWKFLWKIIRRNKTQEDSSSKNVKDNNKYCSCHSNQHTSPNKTKQQCFDNDYKLDEKYKMSRTSTCPLTSSPFNSENRIQSAAIFIIYTYDVLNIFLYAFNSNKININIPFYGTIEKGILIELLIQCIQVIIIGVKFYPLLVVDESDPNIFLHFFAMSYMFLMWVILLLKKSICFYNSAFLKHLLNTYQNDLKDKVNYSINLKKNLTNTFLVLFPNTESISEKYFNDIKEKIPKLFNTRFMKNNSINVTFTQRDTQFIQIINFSENIPLYLTMSYILAKFIVYFLSYLINFLKKKINRNNSYNKENLTIELFNNKKPNHNFLYIKNLLHDTSLINFNRKDSIGKRLTRRIKVSYTWFLFEKYIYKNIPHLRFSKQFVNTYTVAFMIVYFLTLFCLKLSNLVSNFLIVNTELIYKILFREFLTPFEHEKHNFNTEFNMCCFITCFIIYYQLFKSIKSFQSDILRLHRGEDFFKQKPKKEEIQKYTENLYRNVSNITSYSLHYPGYLISHTVYGYVLLFLILFIITIVLKLILYSHGATLFWIKLLLPILILSIFKKLSIKYLIKTLFFKDDNLRITNFTPYYVISYFNFFFDCFLGLFTCITRVWKTAILALINLPRLDQTMFYLENEKLLQKMDMGYYIYLNNVKMEHWYNNPVLLGFCDMVTESMLFSQIYKTKFELLITSNSTNKLIIEDKNQKQYSVFQKIDSNFFKLKKKSIYTSVVSNIENSNLSVLDDVNIKLTNRSFKYEKFLRLRNLLFLCLVLNKNPSLKKYRFHYLESMRKVYQNAKDSCVETKSDFLTRKLDYFL